MTRSTLLSGAALVLVAAALAACGSGSNGSATVSAPAPVAAARLEDSFGTNFGTDYRVPPNAEPVKPATGDSNGLSLTSEPKALHS